MEVILAHFSDVFIVLIELPTPVEKSTYFGLASLLRPTYFSLFEWNMQEVFQTEVQFESKLMGRVPIYG
jgi:hypothetical protein